MICEKCEKEIKDEFEFCPYCGKKVKVKKREAPIKRLYYWSLCNDDMLKREIEKMCRLNLGVEEMADYIKGNVDPNDVIIYQIRVKVEYVNENVYKRPIGTETREDIFDGVVWYAKHMILKFSAIVERGKTTKTRLNQIGKSVFWTEEEGKEAIDKMVEEYGLKEVLKEWDEIDV